MDSEACRFNMKFTKICDRRATKDHRIYDFIEGQLKRTISLGAISETNQQIVLQNLQHSRTRQVLKEDNQQELKEVLSFHLKRK